MEHHFVCPKCGQRIIPMGRGDNQDWAWNRTIHKLKYCPKEN